MKFTLGAIALALAAPAAFAQSSVTIYGIVDLDGQYLSGHAKQVLVTSGGQSGSRIGFKGTEDLGSGYYTDFVLEGGLNIDTGSSAQGGALFGRQAFGALRTPFGTASAGRQYSSIYYQTGDFSEFANVSLGATTAVIGGFAGGYEPIRGSANNATTTTPTGSELNGSPARVNNSFRYTTPTFEGFKASFLAGAGEVTGDTTGTRLFDFSAPLHELRPGRLRVLRHRQGRQRHRGAELEDQRRHHHRHRGLHDRRVQDRRRLPVGQRQAPGGPGRQGLLGRRRLQVRPERGSRPVGRTTTRTRTTSRWARPTPSASATSSTSPSAPTCTRRSRASRTTRAPTARSWAASAPRCRPA